MGVFLRARYPVHNANHYGPTAAGSWKADRARSCGRCCVAAALLQGDGARGAWQSQYPLGATHPKEPKNFVRTGLSTCALFSSIILHYYRYMQRSWQVMVPKVGRYKIRCAFLIHPPDSRARNNPPSGTPSVNWGEHPARLLLP